MQDRDLTGTRSSRPSWWNGQLCESKNLVRKEAPHHTTSTEEVIRLHREKLRKEDEQPALLLPSIYVAHFFFFSIVLDDRKRTKTILIELKKKKKKINSWAVPIFFFSRVKMSRLESVVIAVRKIDTPASLLFYFSSVWRDCVCEEKRRRRLHIEYERQLFYYTIMGNGRWTVSSSSSISSRNLVSLDTTRIPLHGYNKSHSTTFQFTRVAMRVSSLSLFYLYKCVCVYNYRALVVFIARGGGSVVMTRWIPQTTRQFTAMSYNFNNRYRRVAAYRIINIARERDARI